MVDPEETKPMSNPKPGVTRRGMFGRVAGAAALGSMFAGRRADGEPPQAGGVNKNSAPSQLRITDMRSIRIASNYDYPIIRIDTNPVSYTHLRAHETDSYLVCRLLLEKKKKMEENS